MSEESKCEWCGGKGCTMTQAEHDAHMADFHAKMQRNFEIMERLEEINRPLARTAERRVSKLKRKLGMS